MASHWSARRRMAVAGVFCSVAVVAALVVMTGTALAVTVSGKTCVVDRGSYSVRVAADEPTGTVSLYRDGRLVASATAHPGEEISFSGVRFTGLGWHTVRASLAATATVWSDRLSVRAYAVPPKPVLTTLRYGGLTGRRLRLRVAVGSQTYFVALYVNGRFVRKVTTRPNRVNDLGSVRLAKGRNELLLRGGNGAATSPRRYTTTTFVYPAKWKTCIVVDKSELKLYWVVDDVLVRRYPVATGRPTLPTPSGTWRIGVKWTAAWDGPYGGHMMGMYRLKNGRYYFTPFFIHGTNKPESIGTYASHGCVRMFRDNATELYKAVPLYANVQTRD